jgi:hypothetical protein
MDEALASSKEFPVVTLIGPRQSVLNPERLTGEFSVNWPPLHRGLNLYSVACLSYSICQSF